MEVLLTVDQLAVEIPTRRGVVQAVRGVSFAVGSGERIGLVGESGSGKTMTALAILRLLLPPARIMGGHIVMAGRDVLALSPRELERWRGNEVSMIFQDPMTALNPFLTIGLQVAEVLEIHRGLSRRTAWHRAAELLAAVGISDPERRLREYPHQLSGGMRQRVVIAMAMATRPLLIVADEPTTALDVTAQSNVLDLLRELADQSGTAVILITHDLAVVADFCDRVVVMYGGRVMESGPVEEVLSDPAHPYTAALLASIPRIDRPVVGELPAIPGAPPDLSRPLPGCPFAPRCPVAMDQCRSQEPPWGRLTPDRWVACHRVPVDVRQGEFA